jgi:hypothetical protein
VPARSRRGAAELCVWIDGSTVGMFASENTDAGSLTRVALGFRAAAER